MCSGENKSNRSVFERGSGKTLDENARFGLSTIGLSYTDLGYEGVFVILLAAAWSLTGGVENPRKQKQP